MQWMTLSHHLVRNFRASTTLFFFSLPAVWGSIWCSPIGWHNCALLLLLLFSFSPSIPACEAVDDLRSPISWSWYGTHALDGYFILLISFPAVRGSGSWILFHQLVRETRASKALLFFFSPSPSCARQCIMYALPSAGTKRMCLDVSLSLLWWCNTVNSVWSRG